MQVLPGDVHVSSNTQLVVNEYLFPASNVLEGSNVTADDFWDLYLKVGKPFPGNLIILTTQFSLATPSLHSKPSLLATLSS